METEKLLADELYILIRKAHQVMNYHEIFKVVHKIETELIELAECEYFAKGGK